MKTAHRQAARAKRGTFDKFLESYHAELAAMSDEEILGDDPPGYWKAKGDKIVQDAIAKTRKTDIGSGDSWA
jgi:hypothetical protein